MPKAKLATKISRGLRRKLRGGLSTEMMIIVGIIIGVGALIGLTMMNMGQSAASQPRVQVQATYGGGVLAATVEVLNGQITGVQLQYWQQGGQAGQPQNPTACYSRGAAAQWPVYQGQSVTCYWNLQVTAGQRYQYIIYVTDQNGRQIQVARGVFTAGVT